MFSHPSLISRPDIQTTHGPPQGLGTVGLYYTIQELMGNQYYYIFQGSIPCYLSYYQHTPLKFN